MWGLPKASPICFLRLVLERKPVSFCPCANEPHHVLRYYEEKLACGHIRVVYPFEGQGKRRYCKECSEQEKQRGPQEHSERLQLVTPSASWQERYRDDSLNWVKKSPSLSEQMEDPAFLKTLAANARPFYSNPQMKLHFPAQVPPPAVEPCPKTLGRGFNMCNQCSRPVCARSKCLCDVHRRLAIDAQMKRRAEKAEEVRRYEREYKRRWRKKKNDESATPIRESPSRVTALPQVPTRRRAA